MKKSKKASIFNSKFFFSNMVSSDKRVIISVIMFRLGTTLEKHQAPTSSLVIIDLHIFAFHLKPMSLLNCILPETFVNCKYDRGDACINV